MRFTLCPVYPAERGQLPTKNPLPRRGEGLRSLHRSDGGHAAPGWVGFHQKTPLKSPLVQVVQGGMGLSSIAWQFCAIRNLHP